MQERRVAAYDCVREGPVSADLCRCTRARLLGVVRYGETLQKREKGTRLLKSPTCTGSIAGFGNRIRRRGVGDPWRLPEDGAV